MAFIYIFDVVWLCTSRASVVSGLFLLADSWHERCGRYFVFVEVSVDALSGVYLCFLLCVSVVLGDVMLYCLLNFLVSERMNGLMKVPRSMSCI